MSANKLPDELQDPVDTTILRYTQRVLPYLKNTNHTPNDVTTYSFICGLLSVLLLYNGCITAFCILFALSYVFDCMDGQMARKYDMVTKDGDAYDHATDWIVYILLLLVMYNRYKNTTGRFWVLTVLIVALVGTCVYTGCQQVYTKQNGVHATRELQDIFIPLAVPNGIHVARYTGFGCLMLIVLGCVLFLEYMKGRDGDEGATTKDTKQQ